jgi:predicted Zn-dependent protease
VSLIDPLVAQHAERIALDAAEAELVSGPDAALTVLGAPVDPIRLRTALGILARADRYQEAADLIRGRQPDDQWVHWAAMIYSYLGDHPSAEAMVRHADNSIDLISMRRTRLFLVEGMLARIRSDADLDSLLAPQRWPDVVRTRASQGIEILDPLLSLVRANHKIEGDVVFTGVICALQCAHIAGDDRLFAEFCKWLLRHVPVPLSIAEVCLRRLHEAPPGLSNRLRAEHPGDFQAAILAALLDRDIFHCEDDAIRSLFELSERATSEEQKNTLSDVLFETSGHCDPEAIQQAIEIITKLQSSDSRLVGMLTALQLMVAGDLSGAEARLVALRDDDDASWWQAYATLCDYQEKHDEARIAWEKASDLLPHPEITRRAVQASLDRRQFQSAVRSLTKLVESGTVSEKDRQALVWSLMQLGRFAEAAQQLEILVAAEPASVERRMALAQSYGHCARAADGINVLQPVFDGDDAPLEAFFIQSQLLEAVGRAQDAFALLRTVAGNYWDEPQFLAAYMHYGHAAGEDRPAHEAMAQLISLRHAGRVPNEILQEGSLEELLEYSKEFRARRELLQSQVVNGRMPWLFAEDAIGNRPMWAWKLHTQSLRWLSEDALSRAAYSVYATNGFAVRPVDGEKRLEPIDPPATGGEVVVDLTALITLHHLGRLGQLCDYFQNVLLPSRYGTIQIADASRYGQHQPSQEQSLKRIREQIESGRISVIENPSTDWPMLDEYDDTPQAPCYRLQDLIQLLVGRQVINQPEIDDLRSVAHKAVAPDSGLPPLSFGGNVRVDLLTLRTLADRSAFERIIQSCTFVLSNEQQRELQAEILAYEAAQHARDDHDELWRNIADLHQQGKIAWESLPPDDAKQGADATEEDDEQRFYHLDSVSLAVKRSLPLLVDDRILQVLQFNQAPQAGAFGTDQLILALLYADKLTLDDASKDYRKLMAWRYRFIVPPPEMLKLWADEAIDAPPGDALLDVAVYLHDSLRDPGLHCGLEQCEPPMPVALKLVTAWTHSIATFIADVWGDEKYSLSTAEKLTNWAGEELIPSLPRGLWLHPVGHNLARFEASSVLRMAMIQFATIRDADRASIGLATLGKSVGLDDEAFVSIAVETIHAIYRRD